MRLEDHHQGHWPATHGAEGDSSPPHEDCDPVCRYLLPPHQIHNEHPPEAHCQAGQLLLNIVGVILQYSNGGLLSCGLLTTFKYYSNYLIYMYVNCVGLWMVGK